MISAADFTKARNRDQFRSRKNLSMSLAAEAAELLEYMLCQISHQNFIKEYDF